MGGKKVLRPQGDTTMNSVLRTLVLIPSVLTVLALAGCSGVKPDAQAATPTSADAQSDIVETAASAGSFKTLVAAIKAADLEDTLKGPGPFTVFAPTDEAFAKLPEGTVEALLADKEALTAVLTYHVVAGQVTSDAVAGLTEATTVQGSTIAIDTSNGVMINDANVITADVMASNGVIYVIDTVLLPPE